ncbi:MAG: hypothetical protein ABEJ81_07780 [Haloferacaceae archaeon]
MFDGDELAGIVSQFGALTRAELDRAIAELAFKRGEEASEAASGGAIDDALADLRLVAVERDGDRLLAPGPTAFPRLPPDADDLPHILDAGERTVPRAALAESAERRLREAAASAVAAGDRERIEELLDATYDLESWAPEADVGSVRERLDAALAGDGAADGSGEHVAGNGADGGGDADDEG